MDNAFEWEQVVHGERLLEVISMDPTPKPELIVYSDSRTVDKLWHTRGV